MSNARFWQLPFDPDATFIVSNWRPGFTHNGVVPTKGAVFDKAGIKPNVLQELYEQRWIRMAEAHELPVTAAFDPGAGDDATVTTTRTKKSKHKAA